jgi:hypothetical protein
VYATVCILSSRKLKGVSRKNENCKTTDAIFFVSLVLHTNQTWFGTA